MHMYIYLYMYVCISTSLSVSRSLSPTGSMSLENSGYSGELCVHSEHLIQDSTLRVGMETNMCCCIDLWLEEE